MKFSGPARVILIATLIGLARPAIAATGPGSGTAVIVPSSNVVAGANGTWTITYTAAEAFQGGSLSLTIPAGWTPPQNSLATSPGFVMVSTNEPLGSPTFAAIIGNELRVNVDTLTAGNHITVTYGEGASGKAMAATEASQYTFGVGSIPGLGDPSQIGTSPSINVVAAPPSYLAFAPADTTVTAGDFAQYRLLVFDEFGNRSPVTSDVTANLVPTHGSFYPPGNTTTPTTTALIATGQDSVRIDYRATLATAGTPHPLYALGGGLFGSTDVNVLAAAMSPTISSNVPLSTSWPADGTLASVVVTSRDQFGNPRAGDTVVLSLVAGTATVVSPGPPTGADGKASGTVSSTTAGPVTISAAINSQLISQTATVTFNSGPVSGATSTVDATSPVVANGAATSTITVTARDAYGNPIPSQAVTLAVSPTANAVLTQPGGVTNSLGQVTGTLTSTVPGPRTVKASVGAVAFLDSAIVDFTPGSVASFQWTEVDGAATAGVPETVRLTAKDALGNTVTNYTGTVTLTASSAGASKVTWTSLGTGVLTPTGSNTATYAFGAGDNGTVQLTVKDILAETITLAASAGTPSGMSGPILVTAGAADKVMLDSGNNQTATVANAVATPPRVKVTDAWDNPVSGAIVNFNVTGGAGSVGAPSAVTGSGGFVDCGSWTLGTIAGVNTLRASIPSGLIAFVDFTATGTPGNGANLVLAPASKSVTVGAFEVVTATLTDDFNNPKPGTRVDIAITNVNGGTLESNPAHTTIQLSPTARWGNTDASGQITVRFRAPGVAALANTVDGSTSLIPQSAVTDAVYTTTASGATNLRITFTGSSSAPAGTTLQFDVEAVDGGGNVDATNTSQVTLKPEALSNLQFSLTDFGTTITQFSLVAGKRTVYAQGTTAGDWDITVDGVGLGPDTKVATITDTGVISQYLVSTVPSVVAGATFNVSVRAVDDHGNTVVGANNAVNLEAIDDVTTTPAQDTLLVGQTTLTAGVAIQAETYTKAEAIRVLASVGGKQGISNVVTVSAAQAHRIAKVSGDGSGVAVGSPRLLEAQVFDQYDNVVAGEPVTFVVLSGGGSVLPVTQNTNASGIAQSTLTTGTVPGNNQVKASIKDENPASLERVDYLVQTVAGGIAYFTVVPSKLNPVAGEAVNLLVTAYDAQSNVVTGDNSTQIQLSSGSGNVQFGSATGTLSNGTFSTTVVDTVAESFTITAAQQGGGPSGTSASIAVGNAPAYRIVYESGNASGLAVGATQLMRARVRDQYGNPVPNHPVTFAVTSSPGSVTITDGVGDPNDGITTTDGAGFASATLTTALTAGANVVSATILDGDPASRERVSFIVNTVAGVIHHYDVSMGAATAVAGTPVSISIQARDVNNNLVSSDSSTPVALSAQTGTGLTFGQNPVTLAAGVASTTVTSNLVQTYRVQVNTQGDPGVSGVGASVSVTPGPPAGTIAATASADTITANGASSTTITSDVIRDAFGNKVTAGQTVGLSATNGGTIQQNPAFVGSNGTIQFAVVSSTTPGLSTVTMNSTAGSATGTVDLYFAPPVAFTCNQIPVPSIVKPGDSVGFQVLVNNTSPTRANLTTATTFSFSDGVRTFTASLAAPQSVAGAGSATLVFNTVQLDAAFTTGFYQPVITMVGSDQYGSAFSKPCTLPAQAVQVTSIEITQIVAPPQVSVEQTRDVSVTVRNNGAAQAMLNSLTLSFSPGTGQWTAGAPSPGLPSRIDPSGSLTITIPVKIEPATVPGSYQIDASAQATVSGQPVSDNSVAPNPKPSWLVQQQANLEYVAGTLSPMTATQGGTYSFKMSVKNNGTGIVSLDPVLTRLTFTDGAYTYTVAPVQAYAIAGGTIQQMTFVSAPIPVGFPTGLHDVVLNAVGTDNGAPFSQSVSTFDPAGDRVNVQTEAALSAVAGTLAPSVTSKGATAAFQIGVNNNAGGATVQLTPGSTTLSFAGFSAALDPAGPTALPPGTTTLKFLATPVGPAVTPGTYFPQIQVNGTANTLPFASSFASPSSVLIQAAPVVAINAITPSQNTFTADQARRIQMRMLVTNSGGAPVSFTSASLRLFAGAVERTSQFSTTPPAGFALGGATLAPAAIDTLVFQVSDAAGAMSAGNLTIEGLLNVQDVNTSQSIVANTANGGKGSLTVQTPAAISIQAVTPSQPNVTQAMTKPITMRVVLKNTGQSDVTVSPLAATLSFAPSGGGWQRAPRATLASGNNILTGGEVDTLVFDVTNAGSITGTSTIDATVGGIEDNSGRSVSNTSSGKGSIDVQSPGSIVALVRSDRPSVTSGSPVPWRLTVRVNNPGESAVDLLMNKTDMDVIFGGASIEPQHSVPVSLAGGGTVVPGGEVDSFVIDIQSAGTYGQFADQPMRVMVQGIEINSGVRRGYIGEDTVKVQAAPDIQYVSVTPSPVSKGTAVGFAVTVKNPVANGATLTLDRGMTRLRFGGGAFDAGLQPASPVTFAAGEQKTLLFASTVVPSGIPSGPQNDAELVLHWTENGRSTDSLKTIPAIDLEVQDAPVLSIVSLVSSRATVTQGQTSPWTVTMKLQNRGGLPVNLDLAPDKTHLFMNLLIGGVGPNVTPEYTVIQPVALESAGGTWLNQGAVDSLVFTIQQTGTSPGTVIITGDVAGTDPNSQPVTGNTDAGGAGSFSVQTPAALAIQSIVPARTTATVGQTRTYKIRMAVKNTGQADAALDLTQPATDLSFSNSSGWVTTLDTLLAGGGMTLSGGETDTVTFTVTTTGSPAGPAPATVTIGGNVAGTELNTGASRTDNTVSGGTGSITLQDSALVAITGVIASRTSVTQNTSVPWSVTVNVRNNGGAPAILDLPAGVSAGVQDATVPVPFAPVTALQGGGNTLAPGATGTLVFNTLSTSTFTSFGVKPITVTVNGKDANSNEPLGDQDGTAAITVQTEPNLQLVSIDPDTATSGANASFLVVVSNADTSAATAHLDRASTRVYFAGAYSAFLDLTSPIDIPGNGSTTLRFEDKTVSSSIPEVDHDFFADLAYTANGRPNTVTDTLVNGVGVQPAPDLLIQSIAVSQTSVTAGQTTPWTVTMTLQNGGVQPITLDLDTLSTYLSFFAPGALIDPTYEVILPTALQIAGNLVLDRGKTDAIVFTITKTGTLTGPVTINGRVRGLVAGTVEILDDTFDGGRGNVLVQSAANVDILAVHTTQPRVTAGQTATWGVRVVIANNGSSDVDIDFTGGQIWFGDVMGAPGWHVISPTVLLGGGTSLAGGAVDSLLFTVDSTATVADTLRIDAAVRWTEQNTGNWDLVSTDVAGTGFGSIIVQTPPSLRITTTTLVAPNVPNVNTGQNYSVSVRVENTGQAEARDVQIEMTPRRGTSTVANIPRVDVGGGQMQTLSLPVMADTAGADTLDTRIASAFDRNSSKPVQAAAPQDSTAEVNVQEPAQLAVVSVRPSQASVTQGQASPWQVVVTVANPGGAIVDLDPPAEDDLAFAIGPTTQIDYSVVPPVSFGSGNPAWGLAGGATDSLVYQIVSTGVSTGTLDITAPVAGRDRNQPSLPLLTSSGDTLVTVQPAAGLFILSTVSVGTVNHFSANRDTVNTGFGYEMHVAVKNSGEKVDSVLVALTTDDVTKSLITPASFIRQSIDPDSLHTFVYRITAPATPTPLETFTANILPGVVSHNSGQPVTAQPPVDNTQVVVTRTPANLVTTLAITSPPEAAGGTVSTGQSFQMTARVTNTGQAGLTGPAAVTLSLPAGFTVTEDTVRTFVAGRAIVWNVTAPGTVQNAQDFVCAITTTPSDANTGQPAFASVPSARQAVAVSSGGALGTPVVAIVGPAGATDDTVSVSQHFTLRAAVTPSADTRMVAAALTLPAGFSVVGSPTRDLGDGDGTSTLQTDFDLIAPATPRGASDVFVIFTGTDVNSGDPVPSESDTVAVTVVPHTSLSVSASVTAPPDATDNTVTVGTPFTVTAVVTNAVDAADIAAPGGTLTIGLPAGKGFMLNGGETADKTFARTGELVQWVVIAPPQPSGPDQISVLMTGVPGDENSGLPAQVETGTATIAMVTEGAAVAVSDVSRSLGLDTYVVPGGTAGTELLGFRIAYNATDPSAPPAEIDTIAITLVDKDGRSLEANEVAGTLKRLTVDLGGSQPYEVVDPASNPVILDLRAGGTDHVIAAGASATAVVGVDLDGAPRVTEFSVGIRSGALRVRDSGSNEYLGVTDTNGRPLDGQITSRSLVVLSSNFEEYAHNYPNPFRAGSQSTRITYFLERAADVTIRIYSLTGELVWEENIPSSDPRAQAGPREALWDGRNNSGNVVRNGIYVCVLNAGSNSAKFRIAVAK